MSEAASSTVVEQPATISSTSSSSVAQKDPAESAKENTTVIQRKRPSSWLSLAAMLVFYTVGIAWHAIHPSISVFTGQMKPRRLYIDENSAEISYFRANHPKYPSFTTMTNTKRNNKRNHQNKNRSTATSLCQALKSSKNQAGSHHYHHHHHTADSFSPISCYNGQGINVAQILPSSGGTAIEPHNEALVVVVPASRDWNSSPLHLAILHLTQRLAGRQQQQHATASAAWLAKKVFIVAPVYASSDDNNNNSTTLSLQETVDVFLDSYLGSRDDKKGQSGLATTTSTPSTTTTSALPLSFRGAILRQLLVLDHLSDDEASTTSNTAAAAAAAAAAAEIRILPGGRRGVLPNMDLTSMVRFGMGRIRSLSSSTAGSSSAIIVPPRIVMHAHKQTSQEWKSWLLQQAQSVTNGGEAGGTFATKNSPIVKWLDSFLDLVFFEYSLLSSSSSSPPHAEALDRGIDSLTIQTAYCSDPTPVVEALEVILRSLSNLHERLHHSTALYLVTSSDHFVKHEEYLVPNLLVIVPFLVRVLTLLFVDFQKDGGGGDGGFDWLTAQRAMSFIVVTVMWVAYGLAMVDWIFSSSSSLGDKSASMRAWKHVVVSLPYLVLLLRSVWLRKKGPPTATKTTTTMTEDDDDDASTLSIRTRRRQQQSLQFMACLMAIYIHIPIAFGHVSMAFPSALFWSPLLAFGSVSSLTTTTSGWRAWLRGTFWLLILSATCPFALVEQCRIFSSYTPYVKYAYLPLHLMASMLWLFPL